MKALLCTRYCTPDKLELADIAEPTAGPGEAVPVVLSMAASPRFDVGRAGGEVPPVARSICRKLTRPRPRF